MTSPADPKITCPHCKNEVRLTESLAAPLVEATREQYEAKLRAERAAIAAAESKKARLELSGELEQRAKDLADLNAVLAERDRKLAEAQKAQTDAIRKQRELDDAKRELELSIEKRVQESLATARELAKKEAETDLRLKMAEKEQTITAMQRQIEDLMRRAEQGSQFHLRRWQRCLPPSERTLHPRRRDFHCLCYRKLSKMRQWPVPLNRSPYWGPVAKICSSCA